MVLPVHSTSIYSMMVTAILMRSTWQRKHYVPLLSRLVAPSLGFKPMAYKASTLPYSHRCILCAALLIGCSRSGMERPAFCHCFWCSRLSIAWYVGKTCDKTLGKACWCCLSEVIHNILFMEVLQAWYMDMGYSSLLYSLFIWLHKMHSFNWHLCTCNSRCLNCYMKLIWLNGLASRTSEIVVKGRIRFTNPCIYNTKSIVEFPSKTFLNSD